MALQVSSSSDIQADDKTCYICLGVNSPYAGEHEIERVLEKNPCKCTGSIYMHGSCLLEYQKTNGVNQCGICKTKFNYQVEFDVFGRMRMCGLFVNGKREGIWKEYVNYRIRSECTYINGHLNGHAKLYSDIGLVIAEGNYVNNIAHGIWRRYNELGYLVEVCTYINGIKSGPVVTYY